MSDTATRHADLRQMLIERRDDLQDDVRRGIQVGRTDRPNHGRDIVDMSDAHVQGDVEFALVQMRSQTLARIDQALAAIDAGSYGSCVECTGEIAARRLRALPFAVRCQTCEARRENAHIRARQFGHSRAGFSLFPDGAGL